MLQSRYGCCMLLQWLSIVFGCFASVLDIYCKCFNCFRCMLQVFHLDVAKVDQVLHILQWDHLPQPPAAVVGAPPSRCTMSPPACAWKAYEARAVSACCSSGKWRVRSGWRGPAWAHRGAGARNRVLAPASGCGRSSGRPGTSNPLMIVQLASLLLSLSCFLSSGIRLALVRSE
jgi:hypothetical protein